MSALLHPQPRRVEPMTVRMLDAVAATEAQAYAFPWSRGNFIDSLAAGYLAEVLLDESGALLGYQVAMAGVEEMHLLNLTVSPAHWGQGHARFLLNRLLHHARLAGASTLWLEVRQGNERARRVYERYGFAEVGVRRGYYPAPRGTREDAIVMSIAVPEQRHGVD